MEKISYQAIFLYEEFKKKLIFMQKEKLTKVPKDMHCTFKFNPSDKEVKEFSKELLGKEITLEVVGYCSDGKNSGFEVALTPELDRVYTNSHVENINGTSVIKRTTPHITVSISDDAKPADTGLLPFEPIEPFIITGIGGFFVINKEKKTRYVAYNLVNKEKDLEK